MTEIMQRLDNLWAFLNEEGFYTKGNTAYLAKEKITELEYQISVREDEAKMQALQYLTDMGQLTDRLDELTAVLKEVDAWVEGLRYNADDDNELVPVFKKVKAVLKGDHK